MFVQTTYCYIFASFQLWFQNRRARLRKSGHVTAQEQLSKTSCKTSPSAGINIPVGLPPTATGRGKAEGRRLNGQSDPEEENDERNTTASVSEKLDQNKVTGSKRGLEMVTSCGDEELNQDSSHLRLSGDIGVTGVNAGCSKNRLKAKRIGENRSCRRRLDGGSKCRDIAKPCNPGHSYQTVHEQQGMNNTGNRLPEDSNNTSDLQTEPLDLSCKKKFSHKTLALSGTSGIATSKSSASSKKLQKIASQASNGDGSMSAGAGFPPYSFLVPQFPMMMSPAMTPYMFPFHHGQMSRLHHALVGSAVKDKQM